VEFCIGAACRVAIRKNRGLLRGIGLGHDSVEFCFDYFDALSPKPRLR
jgi:hypothetical protein